MSKVYYILLLSLLLSFYSCGNPGDKKAKTSTFETVGINTCDEFLAHYEEWIDDYLSVIDAYFNNPSDEATTNQYMQLMQEGINWSTKWEKLVECADDDKYKKRFEEISKEVEKKLEELGL